MSRNVCMYLISMLINLCLCLTADWLYYYQWCLGVGMPNESAVTHNRFITTRHKTECRRWRWNTNHWREETVAAMKNKRVGQLHVHGLGAEQEVWTCTPTTTITIIIITLSCSWATVKRLMWTRIHIQKAFLSLTSAPQLSRDVAADASWLCDKAVCSCKR
jgi:hypothetical protein